MKSISCRSTLRLEWDSYTYNFINITIPLLNYKSTLVIYFYIYISYIIIITHQWSIPSNNIKQLHLYQLLHIYCYHYLPSQLYIFHWDHRNRPGPAGASELPPDAAQLRRHPGGSARAAGAMPRWWGDRGDFPWENHGKIPAISKC